MRAVTRSGLFQARWFILQYFEGVGNFEITSSFTSTLVNDNCDNYGVLKFSINVKFKGVDYVFSLLMIWLLLLIFFINDIAISLIPIRLM